MIKFDLLKFDILIPILEIFLASCENNKNQLSKINHPKYMKGIWRNKREIWKRKE